MTLDEINARLAELADQIKSHKEMEHSLYAEVGKKALPELAGRSEYADLSDRINQTVQALAGSREVLSVMEAEREHLIAAQTCYSCKTVNPSGAAFCEECGQKLGEKPKELCEACGAMNQAGQKFCGECGARLEIE